MKKNKHYIRTKEYRLKISKIKKLLWQTPTFKNKMIKKFRKVFSNPLIRKKISNSLRGIKKSKEHRNKLSLATKKYLKTHINPNWKGGKPHCKLCNTLLKNYGSNICWSCRLKNMFGKNNPNYHNHKLRGKNHPNYGGRLLHGKGRKFKKSFMRSSWEIVFASFCIKNKIKYRYEYKFFPITYMFKGVNKEGTYTPDFYLPEKNLWIEIKGYWRDDAKTKFIAFKKIYPNIKILLLQKKEINNIIKYIAKKEFIKENWIKEIIEE